MLVSTTTVLAGHAFDCYIELLHNGNSVARAFGEAKSYELLSGHLKLFEKWLNDVKFEPFTSDGTPHDLAFMIAPSCPSLLQRKLELKKLQFIKSDIVIDPPLPPIDPPPPPDPKPSNLNTADKALLIKIFKGTRVKDATIDRLINRRPYVSLNVMASDLKFTNPVITKLKAKLDNGDISF